MSELPPLMREFLAKNFRLLVANHAKQIAELASCGGPSPPKFFGTNEDYPQFEAWLTRVSLLAEGHETPAHDGETFSRRVQAAEELLREIQQEASLSPVQLED